MNIDILIHIFIEVDDFFIHFDDQIKKIRAGCWFETC